MHDCRSAFTRDHGAYSRTRIEKRDCYIPSVSFLTSTVRKRLQLLTVLAAWFLATGAQWDLVQVAGWGRMLASYSRTMSLTQALRKTFGGEMCDVCRVVNEAKRQADTPAVPNADGFHAKFPLIHQPAFTAVPFRTNPTVTWARIDVALPARDRAAPPLPPPRLIAA